MEECWLMNKRLSIAIDGPAAAGKSTVAKQIAQKLSIVYVDTGAMYRALTLKARNLSVDLSDETALAHLLMQTKIELQFSNETQRILLDGEDVTEEIRNNDVTNHVSFVAQHAEVRKEMVNRQQELANDISVVMDGRDIGTRVLPDAEVKIFLKASVKERALRRHKENKEKGFESNLKQLEKEIAQRDELDINRESSPLIQAEDAIAIDTTAMSISEVTDNILHYIRKYESSF